MGAFGTVEFDPGNHQEIRSAVLYFPDAPDLVMVGDRDPNPSLLSIFQDLPDGRGSIRMAGVDMHVRRQEPVPSQPVDVGRSERDARSLFGGHTLVLIVIRGL